MAESKLSAPTVGRDTSPTFGLGGCLYFAPTFLSRPQIIGTTTVRSSWAGLTSIAPRALQHAGRETFRQHRPENGCDQH